MLYETIANRKGWSMQFATVQNCTLYMEYKLDKRAKIISIHEYKNTETFLVNKQNRPAAFVQDEFQ